MKKILSLIIGAVFLAGCKKPYDRYKTTYQTAQAERYAGEENDPLIATKKNIKYMTLPEARSARLYFEKQNEQELVEKALQHVMKLSDNYQEKADCLYELATISLSCGRLETAREQYEQLLREYPGVAFKQEACFRQLLAHYWDCSDSAHDTGMTEKTLELHQDFCKEFSNTDGYRETLEEIEKFCRRVLFEAEILRMNFYLTRYRIFQDQDALYAAQLRLAYILAKLLESHQGLDNATKDLLVEQYHAIKELDAEKIDEKYTLLLNALTTLQKKNE